MALLGYEYSCVACFWSRSVSRVVVLLIAAESVNFHTEWKTKIPICKDFTWVRAEVPDSFKSADVKCWVSLKILHFIWKVPRLSQHVTLSNLPLFPLKRLEPWLIQLSIAALFSGVYTFLDQTLYNLTRNRAVTVGDGKRHHNLFYKQEHNLVNKMELIEMKK